MFHTVFREWQTRLRTEGRGQDVQSCFCSPFVPVWTCCLYIRTIRRESSWFLKSSSSPWLVSALLCPACCGSVLKRRGLYYSVCFVARFCAWSEWIWNTEGPRCRSLSGSGGEVHGRGSLPAVPQQLQLRSLASVPLSARLQTSRSSPGTKSWHPAQGQHAHAGPLSGRSRGLPETHLPVSGELLFPGTRPVFGKSQRCYFAETFCCFGNLVISISLNVWLMRRLTIWSRCCGARPFAPLNSILTPTSRWSLLSPTTASNFRTESLVSQSDLSVNLLYIHLIVFIFIWALYLEKEHSESWSVSLADLMISAHFTLRVYSIYTLSKQHLILVSTQTFTGPAKSQQFISFDNISWI